jgi:hypothetical protein
MRTILFMAFAALLILCACTVFESGVHGQYYKCTDGREVTNLSACDVANWTKNVTPVRVMNVTPAPPVNLTPQRNYSTLRKKNTTSEEQETSAFNTTGSLPDLNGWSVQEIVDGMGTYDENLLGLVPGVITYDPKNVTRYWIGNNPLTMTYDPFWAARSAYAGDVKEYATNHFRIWLAQRPKEFLKAVEAKRNDSKFKLLYPDLWAEWDAIRCSSINSCRNIEAVMCTRGNHTLWMWTHNTPGAAYTETTRYNMQAFDDDRETLTAFEKFYCTPI